MPDRPKSSRRRRAYGAKKARKTVSIVKPVWLWNKEAYEILMMYIVMYAVFCFCEYVRYTKWDTWPMLLASWFLRGWVVFSVVYTNSEWKVWKETISKRPCRGDPLSPSHKKRPDAGMQGAVNRFTKMPKLQEESTYEGSMAVDNSHQARPFKHDRKGSIAVKRLDLGSGQRLSISRTQELHMDHQYIPFSDFLWCSWMVIFPAATGILIGGPLSVGILGIVIRRLMFKLGLTRPCTEEFMQKELVGLLTGTSLLVWSNFDEPNMKLDWDQKGVTHITPHGTVVQVELGLTLDLKTKKITRMTIDGKPASTINIFVLACGAVLGLTHPILHSYANWGTNPECENNWFIRRMSMITVKYNNMGVEGWPYVVDMLKAIGLTQTKVGFDSARLTIHINHNVPHHAQLNNLRTVPGLPYAKLVIDTRRYFLTLFEEYAQDFPGIDGEAHFIGTALHSIDHRNAMRYTARTLLRMEGYIEPEYAADLEHSMYVFHLVVEAPWFRPYENRFSHAPHPLYRKVYDFAKKIDPIIASQMECCIAL